MEHNHFIDKIAIANGFVSGIALYPQVWKVYWAHEISGLSTVFFIIFINSLVWVLYSRHRKLTSLTIASTLNTIASLLLLLAVIYQPF